MEKTSSNNQLLMKYLITLGVPIIILLLPTNEVFTLQMKNAIAFTAGLLIWSAFELTNLLIPTIIWSALLVFTKTVPAATVFSSYMSATFYGATGMMIFAVILARIGVLRRLAFWISAKSGGTFGNLTFCIFFAVFAIAMITFTGGVIVAAAFVFGVCKALDYVGKKEGAVLTMAGIIGIGTVRMFWTYPITVGMMNTSVQTTANPDFVLTFTTLLKYNWPCFLFCLLFIYIMLVVTKTKNLKVQGGKEYFVKELEEMGPLNRDEKIGAIALIAIVLWIVTNPITGWDMMIGYCLIPSLLFLPGIDVGNQDDIKNFSFGTLVFVMGCMAIGSICTEVGIVDLIKNFLAPLLSSLGSVWSLFVVLISAMIGNFGMTPNALLAGFSGMIYTIFESMGINPLSALFAWNMGCDLVFLPYEYATPLLFMAFGAMSVGQFFKLNVVKNILFIVFFGVIMIPYWFFVGLI